MKLAALMLITLSNQGYWFGGQVGTVTFEPTAQVVTPACRLTWQLMLDQLVLGSGTTMIEADADKSATKTVLRFMPPAVRTRVATRLTYQIREKATGKDLASGELAIQLFPENLLADIDRRIDSKSLYVFDSPTGLCDLFDKAKISYIRIASTTQLLTTRPQLLLVGADRLQSDLVDQMPLLALARSGTSVMIFRQTHCPSLAGYPLVSRFMPPRLQWRQDHPLLIDYQPGDLRSWIEPDLRQHAIRLQRRTEAVKIGYDPSEANDEEAESFDVLLMTQAMGRGRIVMCQLPLGPWNTDPRSQLLVRNAMDYLLLPPQPTLTGTQPTSDISPRKRFPFSGFPVPSGGLP